jgi:7-carboxy-7-deazaguanine synthase (Cx14CxxC type)
MTYSVKEMFATLQGEGAQAGRAAIFIRFAGCNLWSGREQDRASAICQFCDTDFVGTDGEGGAKFAAAEDLAAAALALWPRGHAERRYAVLTGGEPMMQVDDGLVEALHSQGFEIAIETNGTFDVHGGIDWVCVSPKSGADLVQVSGDELKVVFPQMDQDLDALGRLDFAHLFVQPMDGPDLDANTRAATAWCLAHPAWKLSLQTHKLIGIA